MFSVCGYPCYAFFYFFTYKIREEIEILFDDSSHLTTVHAFQDYEYLFLFEGNISVKDI